MGLLKLENVHVALEDGTPIVKGVDLEVGLNEVHAVMGPNGSGKSTLSYAIMGHPAYQITEGRILLDGDDVTEMAADERAQRGLFLAFQYPHAIPGVTVTITSATLAVTRSTVSDASGQYQFFALPPGVFSVKVELTGFRTATRDKVELPVDVRTKMDVPMEIGQMSETVEVTSLVSPINTTDASMGNTIAGAQGCRSATA